MTEIIRYGIMGTADIAREWYIAGGREATNTEITAIASRSQEKAQRFADEFDIPHAYGSYDDLLASDEIDAVIIPLPNTMHHEWVMKSLDAGKHVLIDKPFAMNVEQAVEMRDKAAATGLKLMEGFMYRQHPQHQFVLDKIASGTIGAVKIVKTELVYPLGDWVTNLRANQKLGGGGLFDAGCYTVSGIRMLMGDEPISVQAFQVVDDKTNVDKNLVAILKFPEGRLGYLCTGMEHSFKNSYEILGTKGRIVATNTFSGAGYEPSPVMTITDGSEEQQRFPAMNQFTPQFQHFSDCILSDSEPLITPEDSVRNTAVLQAIAQAARTESIVHLRDIYAID